MGRIRLLSAFLLISAIMSLQVIGCGGGVPIDDPPLTGGGVTGGGGTGGVTGGGTGGGNPTDSAVVSLVLDSINEFRANQGLSALSHDGSIAAVSQAYADLHEAQNAFRYGNYSVGSTLDGKTASQRLSEAGISFSVADEDGAANEASSADHSYFISHFSAYARYKTAMSSSAFTRCGIGSADWEYTWAG